MLVLARLKAALLCMAVLLLSACHTNEPKPFATVPSLGAQERAARAYALTSPSHYQADATGLRVNPLTAPANQSYYFSFNESAMRPKDLNALNVQAAYLVTHPQAVIQLNGNTDGRGSREYNVALGWRRDQAVARFLLQQGVAQTQVKMVSYGKEKPVALGHDAQSWALNRRVDLIYKAY